MRVLHVQKVAGIGGSERHLVTLLPRLAARGIDVRMLVLATADATAFTSRLAAAGVDHHVVPAGPDLSPRIVRAILREIGEFGPDIVHTHLIHADTHGQLAARLAGVPGVNSIHSAHRFYSRQPYRTPAWMAGRLARRSIAISEHVARYATSVGIAGRDRVRVVPYGIDADGWQMSDAERDAARAIYGVRRDEFVVGIAARLIPHKGHTLLFRAAERLATLLPHLRVLVAGDGPLRDALENEASQMAARNVEFVGFVDDVRTFMNACDVLAFLTMPELNEGFGLAALEGMAAACPVVVTRVGPLPEVVGEGEGGIVVDPGSVDELELALTRLASDPSLRARLGGGGRRRARERFSVDAMVGGTLRVYAELS
jgi:glycosyltransferase involved in cell wall biosynthesis